MEPHTRNSAWLDGGFPMPTHADDQWDTNISQEFSASTDTAAVIPAQEQCLRPTAPGPSRNVSAPFLSSYHGDQGSRVLSSPFDGFGSLFPLRHMPGGAWNGNLSSGHGPSSEPCSSSLPSPGNLLANHGKVYDGNGFVIDAPYAYDESLQLHVDQPSLPRSGPTGGCCVHPDGLMTEPSTKPRRGLPRCRSRYSLLPMADGKRLPISIPTVAKQSWDPMQRWRESPPESEAASIAAIFDAVQTTDIPRVQYPGRGAVPSSRVGSWTQDSVSSVSSSRSSRSNTSRRLAQRPSVGQRIRARANHRASNESLRIFCCTFCCDTFRTKHDWTRHEKSLHLNCDQWACTPYGGIVVSPVTMRSQCSYCNMLDPTSSHLETHKHGACRNNQQEPFRRKDHLIQHLRGFHQLDTLPPVEDWRIQGPVITSRCGFCDERLESWEARANHLADHFRQGKTMANWTGDHGFEPSIASQVRNSLPPYHLAFEASSLVPFSATDPRTTDHLAQLIETHGRPEQPPSQKDLEIPLNDSQLEPEVLTPTLFTPFLVWHLGRFAQQSVAVGVVPTDQMFQDEARRLMYGDDGNWERTVADNSEWMAAFRNQHWPNNHK